MCVLCVDVCAGCKREIEGDEAGKLFSKVELLYVSIVDDSEELFTSLASAVCSSIVRDSPVFLYQ